MQFADVMEWDLTGEAILYDAFNNLQSNTSQDISYWDIGLIKVWDKGSATFDEGQVIKLFNGLAENESVGNPSFSKNSPYIITFDFLSTDFFGDTDYTILGANIETGTIGLIRENSRLGYPSFSPDDDEVLFSAESNTGANVLGRKSLAADKITGIGDPSILVSGPFWGHWFANGQRDLVSVNNTLKGSLKLFPNPANDEVNLNISGFENGNFHLSLFNMLGQTMISRKLEYFGNAINLNLDVRHLAAGSYYLEIRNETGENKVELVIIE